MSASPEPSSGPERLGGTLSAATLGGAVDLPVGGDDGMAIYSDLFPLGHPKR